MQSTSNLEGVRVYIVAQLWEEYDNCKCEKIGITLFWENKLECKYL